MIQPDREHRIALLPDIDDRRGRALEHHAARLDRRRQLDGDRRAERPAEDHQPFGGDALAIVRR